MTTTSPENEPVMTDIPMTIGRHLRKCDNGHTYTVSLHPTGPEPCPYCGQHFQSEYLNRLGR